MNGLNIHLLAWYREVLNHENRNVRPLMKTIPTKENLRFEQLTQQT